MEALEQDNVYAGIDAIDPINRGYEYSNREHIELMVFDALTVHDKGDVQ